MLQSGPWRSKHQLLCQSNRCKIYCEFYISLKSILQMFLVYTCPIVSSINLYGFQNFLKFEGGGIGCKFGCKIKSPVIADQCHIWTDTIYIAKWHKNCGEGFFSFFLRQSRFYHEKILWLNSFTEFIKALMKTKIFYYVAHNLWTRLIKLLFLQNLEKSPKHFLVDSENNLVFSNTSRYLPIWGHTCRYNVKLTVLTRNRDDIQTDTNIKQVFQ